jgi:hypothetical protein
LGDVSDLLGLLVQRAKTLKRKTDCHLPVTLCRSPQPIRHGREQLLAMRGGHFPGNVPLDRPLVLPGDQSLKNAVDLFGRRLDRQAIGQQNTSTERICWQSEH